MSKANPNLNQKPNSNSNSQSWYKSPMLLGWLFLVFAAMAGTIYMVIQANSGFPGLVVDDFYERGQDYEENILKKLANNEKWVTEFKLTEVHLNKPAVIIFSIRDKAGMLAKVEKMTLFAYRPSNSKKDFNKPMSLSEDTNTHQVTLTFDTKGKWELIASAVIDGIEVNYPKAIFVKD